jgi:hypothetical protein
MSERDWEEQIDRVVHRGLDRLYDSLDDLVCEEEVTQVQVTQRLRNAWHLADGWEDYMEEES